MPIPVASAPANWREELRAMLRLGGPLVLANLAQIAITTTDVLMVGWLGAEPLAASALAVNLFNIILFSGMGLGVATAPLIAAALGARRHAVRETRRSFRMGLWLVSFYAAAGLLVLANAEQLFILFGQDPRLSAQAAVYMNVIMWAIWPALVIAVFRTLLTAFDRTAITLVVTLAGVVLNAGLNWLLIFGNWGAPRLELVGSAIASLITNLAMALALGLIIRFAPRFRRMHLFGRLFRPDWSRLKRLWVVGLPIAGSWAFEVTVFSAAVYLMGLIDTVSVAAHVIALQLASLTFMVPMGLAQAVTIRVGLGYGAQNPAWVSLAGRVAFGLTMVFMASAALVMWTFPRELAGLFLDRTRPDSGPVLDLAVRFLVIAAVFQLADGAQVVGAAMLRGLQDTRVPMIYAGFGYWLCGLGSGAVLAFVLGWRGVGVWTGLAIGLAIVAALMLTRWSRRERLGLVPAVPR
ncbi:MATE family efflux transporter [Sphingomonas arenae]|uniref:MATE family efflux transporter n=1 Tax=Sphingomonas arenae TaxID=2812555 RepID=UPI00196850BD|nr:MATE family efflux transporter [Sphingomonas arenae]